MPDAAAARAPGAASPPIAHATTPAAVQAAVREAAAAGAPLRIMGAGSWLDAGRPARAERGLALRELTGVVAYEPGDLTITARAGTPLSELHRLTSAEGQWLPLDPFGAAHGTLGATVATAAAGPLAASLGLVRDVVLGLEAVLGTGEIVRAGGRVVKNVAGFDLVRLLTGAWGTLGVLTEVTVRLRARPERDETLALPLPTPGGASALDAWLLRLEALPVEPAACELVDAALAATLGLERRPLALVRLAGSDVAVAAQRDALVAFADAAAVPGDVWARLAGSDPTRAPSVRWSAAPSRLAALWAAATADAPDGAHTHATVRRGVVRQWAAPGAPDETLAASWGTLPARAGGAVTTIPERLPAGLWPVLASPSPAAGLAAGVRRAFDPQRLLNPGILPDGSDAADDTEARA